MCSSCLEMVTSLLEQNYTLLVCSLLLLLLFLLLEQPHSPAESKAKIVTEEIDNEGETVYTTIQCTKVKLLLVVVLLVCLLLMVVLDCLIKASNPS